MIKSLNTIVDPSLIKLQQLMIDSFLIIGPLKELASRNHHKGRYCLLICLIVFIWFYVIRSLLYFAAVGKEYYLNIMGDYLYALGSVADIIYFWWIMYSILVVVFWSVFTYNSYFCRLNIVTDFLSLIDGVRHLKDTKFTTDNWKKWKKLTKYSINMISAFWWSLFISIFIIHAIGVWISFNIHKEWILLLYQIFWFIMGPFVWMIIALKIFALGFAIYFLSCSYIKIRFKQLKLEFLRFKNSLTDGSLSYFEASKNLNRLLDEYSEISLKVTKYNHIIKWIILEINYLFTPLAAVSVYFTIYKEFVNIFLTGAILWTAVILVSAVFFFASIAGGVYIEVKEFIKLNNL